MAHKTNKISVTEIDFDALKDNLKTFLQSQSEFSDFDFEGSGMNILLDQLAYNTHYIALHANLVGNEMFLDSATLRESVVSLAKQLNYTPKSKTAPNAKLDVTLTPIGTPPSVIIEAGTEFNTTKDGTTYTFSTLQDVTILEDGGNYIATGLDIYEGHFLNFNWTVDTSLSGQRFVIPNNSIDTSTLTVTVQNSSGDTTTFPFIRATTIDSIDGDQRVYWLQEVEDNQFELVFGNDVVGRALLNGNIINISYLVTKGDASNSASTFVATDTIAGLSSSNFSFTVSQVASGGADHESIESIKFLAPKLYQTQGRAVTITDYQNILLDIRQDIDIITGWGGEENDPPQFGQIFLAMKPIGLEKYSEAVKIDIQTELQEFNIIPMQPIIVDPDLTYFNITSSVHYNAITLKDTIAQLQTQVETTIKDYFSSTLSKFNETFRFSVFGSLIDDSNQAILNNDTSIVLEKRFLHELGVAYTTVLNFNNAIEPGSLSSNPHTIGALTNLTFDDDGNGTIRCLQGATVLNLTAGTIDYNTGTVNINNLTIDSFDNPGDDRLKIFVTPASNDVTSLRDQVLAIDEDDSNSISVSLISETI